MSTHPAPGSLRRTGTGIAQPLPTSKSNTGYDYWVNNAQDNPEWDQLAKEISETLVTLPKRGAKGVTPELMAIARDPNSKEKLKAYVERAKSDIADKEEKRKEEEKEKEKRTGKTRKAVSSITPIIVKSFDFLIHTLEATDFVAAEITVGTHYTVALKALTLFYHAYKDVESVKDDLETTFKQIDCYVPTIEFFDDVIQNVHMQKAIFRLRVSFVWFFVSATKYLNHDLFVKMAYYLGGKSDKFKGLIKNIENAYLEVDRVRGVAQLSITLEGLKRIHGLGEDNKRLGDMLAVVAKNITSLVEKPDMWTTNTSQQLLAVYEHANFSANLHVQSLRKLLFKKSYEPTLELAFNDRERKYLPPKDRWHRHFHGFVATRQSYNPASRRTGDSTSPTEAPKYGESRPLIWIAGSVSRRNTSWVSSFSVDLLTHLPEFSNIDTVYTFCKRGQGVRYTPALLVKGLISQLLELYPEVATQNIRHLSVTRFNNVGDHEDVGAAYRAWILLEDILGLLMGIRKFHTREILILIDRLDLCASNKDYGVMKDLLPKLQNLSHDFRQVRVIITVAKIHASKIKALRTGPSWLLAYGRVKHG